MNFISSEEEILKTAKQILTGSSFGYDDESSFRIGKLNESSNDYYRHIEKVWSIFFLWGEDIFGKSRTAILSIDDQTLMPIELRHTMGQSVIRYSYDENNNEIKTSTGVRFKIDMLKNKNRIVNREINEADYENQITKKIEARIGGIIDHNDYWIYEIGMPNLTDKKHTRLKTVKEIKHSIQNSNLKIEDKEINIELSEKTVGVRSSIAEYKNIFLRLKKDETTKKIEIGDNFYFVV